MFNFKKVEMEHMLEGFPMRGSWIIYTKCFYHLKKFPVRKVGKRSEHPNECRMD